MARATIAAAVLAGMLAAVACGDGEVRGPLAPSQPPVAGPPVPAPAPPAPIPGDFPLGGMYSLTLEIVDGCSVLPAAAGCAR